jgi:hypothetical protein
MPTTTSDQIGETGRAKSQNVALMAARAMPTPALHGLRDSSMNAVPSATTPQMIEIQEDAARVLEQHVAGLHVAVDEPRGVKGVERRGDLRDDRRRIARRERPVVAQ